MWPHVGPCEPKKLPTRAAATEAARAAAAACSAAATGDGLGEAAGAEVAAQRAEAEGETPESGSDKAAVSAAEAKLLDASTLQPGESLAGRDLQGWTLRGDFSGRVFDAANLRRAVARCANFRNASMRGVDASRADFRGASLAGVAVHGARFRGANCQLCLLYTSPSPRDGLLSRMPSSA